MTLPLLAPAQPSFDSGSRSGWALPSPVTLHNPAPSFRRRRLPVALRLTKAIYQMPHCWGDSLEDISLQNRRCCGFDTQRCGVRLDCALLCASCAAFGVVLTTFLAWEAAWPETQRFAYERLGLVIKSKALVVLPVVFLELLSAALLAAHVWLSRQGQAPRLSNFYWAILLPLALLSLAGAAVSAAVYPQVFQGVFLWLRFWGPVLHAVAVPICTVQVCLLLRTASKAVRGHSRAVSLRPQDRPLLGGAEDSAPPGMLRPWTETSQGRGGVASSPTSSPGIAEGLVLRTPRRGAAHPVAAFAWLAFAALAVALWGALLALPFFGSRAFGSPCVFQQDQEPQHFASPANPATGPSQSRTAAPVEDDSELRRGLSNPNSRRLTDAIATAVDGDSFVSSVLKSEPQAFLRSAEEAPVKPAVWGVRGVPLIRPENTLCVSTPRGSGNEFSDLGKRRVVGE